MELSNSVCLDRSITVSVCCHLKLTFYA